MKGVVKNAPKIVPEKYVRAKSVAKKKRVVVSTSVRKPVYSNSRHNNNYVVRRNGPVNWDIVKIIKQYGWDWRIAAAIAIPESGYNPYARNPSGACGIFQLHPCPNIKWWDPKTNIEYAYYNKYKCGGWSHWTVYTSGSYRSYLYLFN